MLIGLTGSLLVFADEIDRALVTQQFGQVILQEQRIFLNTILNTVKTTYSDRADWKLGTTNPRAEHPLYICVGTLRKRHNGTRDAPQTTVLIALTRQLLYQVFPETPFLPDTPSVLDQYWQQFLPAAFLPAAAPNQSALPVHRLIEPPRFLKSFQNWKVA